MNLRKSLFAMLPFVSIFLAPAAYAQTSLLNTANSTIPNGSTSTGLGVDQYTYLGAGFSTTQAFTVTSLGFNGGGDSAFSIPNIYLVKANSDFTPVDSTLSSAVYTSKTMPPITNSDVTFFTNFLLPAGNYDLFVGVPSGASGNQNDAYVTQGEAVNGTQVFLNYNQGSTKVITQVGGTGERFFVNGTPAAVPEASTTVSFGLLLVLGASGLLVAKQRSLRA